MKHDHGYLIVVNKLVEIVCIEYENIIFEQWHIIIGIDYRYQKDNRKVSEHFFKHDFLLNISNGKSLI
jgi:hypothetical protein